MSEVINNWFLYAISIEHQADTGDKIIQTYQPGEIAFRYERILRTNFDINIWQLVRRILNTLSLKTEISEQKLRKFVLHVVVFFSSCADRGHEKMFLRDKYF